MSLHRASFHSHAMSTFCRDLRFSRSDSDHDVVRHEVPGRLYRVQHALSATIYKPEDPPSTAFLAQQGFVPGYLYKRNIRKHLECHGKKEASPFISAHADQEAAIRRARHHLSHSNEVFVAEIDTATFIPAWHGGFPIWIDTTMPFNRDPERRQTHQSSTQMPSIHRIDDWESHVGYVWLCLAEVREHLDLRIETLGHDDEWLACGRIPSNVVVEAKHYTAKSVEMTTPTPAQSTGYEDLRDFLTRAAMKPNYRPSLERYRNLIRQVAKERKFNYILEENWLRIEPAVNERETRRAIADLLKAINRLVKDNPHSTLKLWRQRVIKTLSIYASKDGVQLLQKRTAPEDQSETRRALRREVDEVQSRAMAVEDRQGDRGEHIELIRDSVRAVEALVLGFDVSSGSEEMSEGSHWSHLSADEDMDERSVRTMSERSDLGMSEGSDETMSEASYWSDMTD